MEPTVIKTVQWNIGGAKIRREDSNAHIAGSYDTDGLEEIVALLRSIQPDIITLQEIHADSQYDQVGVIAEKLGLLYWVSNFYADSHLEDNKKLGQGIISRFPIAGHNFQLFCNPRYEAIWEDGRKIISHDKGVTTCTIHYKGLALAVKTLHLVPFKRFKVDPLSEAARNVISDVEQRLKDDSDRLLIQGDFNVNLAELREIFPRAFENATEEIPQKHPTRVNGRRLDHVIYRGLYLLNTTTLNTVLTDHYPIVSSFGFR